MADAQKWYFRMIVYPQMPSVVGAKQRTEPSCAS